VSPHPFLTKQVEHFFEKWGEGLSSIFFSKISSRRHKKDLACSLFLPYSFPSSQPHHIMSDKFAIYQSRAVLVLGIEGDEALISFDDGREEYVSIESLSFL